MLKQIEKYLNVKALQEECRKIGVNFVTAGIVGVFIDHYVGSDPSTMFWTAVWITWVGAILLTLGLFKRGDDLS